MANGGKLTSETANAMLDEVVAAEQLREIGYRVETAGSARGDE